MATLHIRNLDDRIQRQLRQRAAKNGRSMEAEARAALGEAVAREHTPDFDPARLQALVARMFAGHPPKASRQLIHERRQEARREAKR